MMSSWFDFGSTLKILNLSFLRFNERSEFQNHENDFARGISRIKSHLSGIRGCDVPIWEWRKRDSVGVIERDVESESGIQILYTIFCVSFYVLSITTCHVFV